MPLYIVATANGEIIKSGSSSSNDISIQAKAGQFAMFIPELSREDDAKGLDVGQYITFDEDGPAIADRPVFDVPDTIQCSVGKSIRVSNLPHCTIATVDDGPTSVEAGTLELVFLCVGEFAIRLETFPHISKNVTIVVS